MSQLPALHTQVSHIGPCSIFSSAVLYRTGGTISKTTPTASPPELVIVKAGENFIGFEPGQAFQHICCSANVIGQDQRCIEPEHPACPPTQCTWSLTTMLSSISCQQSGNCSIISSCSAKQSQHDPSPSKPQQIVLHSAEPRVFLRAHKDKARQTQQPPASPSRQQEKQVWPNF